MAASCRTKGALHNAAFLTVPKILSLEEIFARPSLQEYLQQIETNVSERRGEGVSIQCLIQNIRHLRAKEQELEETELPPNEEDQTLQKLAEQRREGCAKEIQTLRQKILDLLLPDEEDVDLNDLILEVTAGLGQEAMRFTGEVFIMYQRFAKHHGWSLDILDYKTSDLGGLRRASARVYGHQCYKKLKFEAGVHRVQRIPKTDKKCRMHTSTMTVAVLAQPTEISLRINHKDLKVEAKRPGGAGSRQVNTTDTAVRIVHLPTGVVAECQQRPQVKNKEIAMKVLRAKLYCKKLEEETNGKRYQQHKIQVGIKSRSEKMRTYNFSKNHVNDHRIGMTLYDVKTFLLGEDLLDEMNSSLQAFSNQEALFELLKENK